MPVLKIILMEGGQPIAATYPPSTFFSTLLDGGALVVGPVAANSPPANGYIRVDTIRVELAAPGVHWRKDFRVRTTGSVFQVADGCELTVLFDDPSEILVVERSPAVVAAMRKLIASIP